MSEINDKKQSTTGSGITPKSASNDSQELTSRILDFLSTASNEKLGACALGLGAATYFVLGRVGLLLIGAVGGVVLHATWEGHQTKDVSLLQKEQKRRKEASLDIVKRLLDWQDMRRKDDIQTESALPELAKDLNFDTFQSETAAALDHIVERVIDDYVKWWYTPILPVEDSFPAASRRTFTSFLLTFSTHLSRKRPEDVFLNFLTNSTSIFIVFLGELSRALMAQAAIGKDPADSIALYLTDYPDSSFANVLDRDEQTRKLKAVSEDVLQTFLEKDAYQFNPARTFLKEVLAGLILEPTLVSCSKAEWINGWIVYLLEQGEPEIMNAINAGVGEATARKAATAPVVAPQQLQPEVIKTEDDEDREALEEVRRLNALIASEQFQQDKLRTPVFEMDHSSVTKDSEELLSSAPSTDNLLTPSSSDSDLAGHKTSEFRQDLDHEEHIDPEPVHSSPGPMTSFDQIVSQDQMFVEPVRPLPLTLHKALVTIFDDAQPNDKSMLRSKPNIDYLLQIEPASTQHPGWMIARKYADFETLHEVLRRISVISGVPEFSVKFATVPGWRGQTKNSLRADLESYLKEALTHARLAESEGMKRFLEKDQGLEKLGNSKGVLGFPSPEAFQNMGKGMLDTLASAPKGAASGGKALLDGMKGVGGVFGGQKRSTSRPREPTRTLSTSTLPRMSEDQSSRTESIAESARSKDGAEDSIISSRTSMESSRPPALPARPSVDTSERPQTIGSVSGNTSRLSFQESKISTQSIPEDEEVSQEPVRDGASPPEEELLNLPPRPDEIDNEHAMPRTAQAPTGSTTLITNDPAPTPEPQEKPSVHESTIEPSLPTKPIPKKNPFTTEETSVAVELIFAVINELYTLSSAWNIRKTLLNAAKTFLLRPGNNPSLTQIRTLLQDSVITANTTDAGIAHHLRKLRENSLPTEEELAAWPPPLNDEEKEKLRRKARRLLVETGMPPALRGIMGAAASGEALGRLFDSLQVEEVSRGLLFAVMLQSIRAVTH